MQTQWSRIISTKSKLEKEKLWTTRKAKEKKKQKKNKKKEKKVN